METKRTALPFATYEASPVHNYPLPIFNRNTNIVLAHALPFENDPEKVEANAAFIVRACNAHYDILEACEALVARCMFLEHEYAGGGPDSRFVTQARAAIAKAKGCPRCRGRG